MATMHYYNLFKERAYAYLGGKCVECGSTSHLEFDHIDPATKSFTVGQGWSLAWETVKEELDKCQLLCKPCHVEKHRLDNVHGTLGGYSNYKCRCPSCKEVWNTHSKEYRRKWRASKRLSIPLGYEPSER